VKAIAGFAVKRFSSKHLC